MTEPIVVVGAGGFGREVLDVIDAINASINHPAWDVLGVIDDAPSDLNLARLERRGVSYLGDSAAFLNRGESVAFSVGIGNPRVRRMIVERFEGAGCASATLIHPSATHGAEVTIGAGSVVCAGVRLTTNISLGRHVHLNPNVTVGHDTTIGDFVSVNPLASISGDCTLEDGVLVGVAGVVLNQLNVGHGAIVGGSACVVRDVPPGAVVKGVPAR